MERALDQHLSKPPIPYRRAVFMVVVGGALLSLLGIGVRLMESANSHQIIFFRSIFSAIFLFVWLAIRDAPRPFVSLKTLKGKGVLAATFLAFASFFMILSLAYTSVANAVFIISLAPLCSAVMGRLILQEHVPPRTWRAIAIALVGITIIFADGLSTGGLLGMFCAFMMMLLYSSSLITIRSQSSADMIAVCAVSGALLALGVAPLVESFELSARDLLLCLGLGVFQISLGMVLITSAAQFVPAAQVSLLALLEVVLGPVWVWIGVGEVPTSYSLIGGAIVLVGVGLQAASSSKN